MFLDEELEQIHAQENVDIKAKSVQMLKAMIKRVPKFDFSSISTSTSHFLSL